ncbi:hypothetical protein OIO90_004831 [Microbotryomycetes sp. JL221]|nr:hypothetical protein OIO90_004831 [Microbotryomycetes sp. JL221]
MPAKIAVIYSSTYGHVRTLAEKIAEAAKGAGAEVDLYQFPEILSDEVLQKMHAAPKAEYPVITPNDLTKYDGFLFGIPTRYGRAVASASAFFDQTGGLWAQGALVGKFAGVFHSTASQHGGQETTTLTTLPFFAHHGIIYVPIGYTMQALAKNDEITAGSAWGSGAIANGDGSRQPTSTELEVAAYQGKNFADIVGTYVAGKAKLAGGSDAVAAKAVPASATAVSSEPAVQESKPYQVDNTTAPATAATPAENAQPAAAATPAQPTTTEQPSSTQPTTAQPVQKAAERVVDKQQKKGGLFAGCCGKANHYDS